MRRLMIILAILLLTVTAGCRRRRHTWTGGNDNNSGPEVVSTNPADGATNVNVSQSLTAVFSDDMDPGSINSGTFQLTTVSHAPVSGTVSYDEASRTATFDPSNPLAANTSYEARVTEGTTDINGNALECEYVWVFTTGDGGPAPDTNPPTVSGTDPATGETVCSRNQDILAMFSEAMDPSSINSTTFFLTDDSTSLLVPGVVSYDPQGFTAIFNPDFELDPRTSYTATITTGVRDAAGNSMASDYVWTFMTCSVNDTSAPRVVSTDPFNGETSVPLGTNVSATFNETIDPATCTAAYFTLEGPGSTPVAGTVSCVGSSQTTMIFNPNADLLPGTLYTATIKAGVRDLSGNVMTTDYVWTFTTAGTADNVPPTVISTNPLPFETGVGLNRNVNATFSEAMDPSTINSGSFTLRDASGALVNALVSYDVANHIAILDPVSDLLPNTQYTARITTQVTDLSGNHMAEDFVWTFTTGTLNTGTPPVDLGEAAGYAILAGEQIANVGPTLVNGDIGVDPYPLAFTFAGPPITGFPPGQVNGTQRVYPDPALRQAKTDLVAAFTEALGRPGATIIPAELGGQVLLPGLYKSATGAFTLSTGNLTLDGQGDPDAVWVFQVPGPGNLTIAASRQVVLINGALSNNVNWAVNYDTIVGAGAVVRGNLLTCVNTVLGAGTIVDGRALDLLKNVTTDSNLISVP